MNRVAFTFILLISIAFPAVPSTAAEAGTGNCDASEKGFLKKLDRARSYFTPTRPGCDEAAKGVGEKCSVPRGQFCEDFKDQAGIEALGRTGGQGTADPSNDMVKKMLRTANCYRGVKACLNHELEKIDKACGKVDTSKPATGASGAGASAPGAKAKAGSKPPAPAVPAEKDKDNSPMFGLFAKVDLREIGDCMTAQGAELEAKAREVFATSNKTKTPEQLAREQLICRDKTSRVCDLNTDGTQKAGIADEKNPEEMRARGATPALVGDACSGTLLRDGQTVSTAGHCTEDINGSATRTLQVTDGNGQTQTVMGRCARGQYEPGKQDFSTCTLDTALPAPDNYLLSRDDSIATCQTVGLEYRCPNSRLQKISSEPVTIYGYTSDEAGVRRLNVSEGYVRYEERYNSFYTSAPTQPGISGAGYMVDLDGRRVILSSNSHGSSAESVYGGAGNVLTPDQLELTRTQLRAPVTRTGEPLMRSVINGSRR